MKTILPVGMSDRSNEFQRARRLLSESGLSQRHPQSAHRLSAEAIECPKCSKRSVVRRSPNVFDCINCSFHKELAPVALSAPLPTAHLSRHSLPPGHPLTSHSLTGHSRLSQGSFPLDETTEQEKTHPLVFAALMVIIGILFL